MTQDEKLVARLKGLENGLYEVKILVIDGRILFWVIPSPEEVEGLPKGIAEIPH